MRENDGRKLDHAALEAIRILAVQAVEAGERPEDVARYYSHGACPDLHGQLVPSQGRPPE